MSARTNESILFDEWKQSKGTQVIYKDRYYCAHLTSQKLFKEWVLQSITVPECAIHEVILPGYPVRLFLDIECKGTDLTQEVCEARFADVLKRVRDSFVSEEKLGDLKSLGAPIILDATKYPVKFSVHVVFPNVWFVDSGHLGRFIRPIAEKFPAGFVDVGVYRERSISQLRMAYTNRPEDPSRIFRPRKGPQTLTLASWNFFVRCCVGCTVAIPSDSLLSFGTSEDPKRTKFSGQDGDGNSAQASVEIERVVKYIEIIHGPIKIQNTRLDGDGGWTFKFVPGLFCEARAKEKGDGYHAQTSTIIGKDAYGKVYHLCMDDQCRTRHYFRENIGQLLLIK